MQNKKIESNILLFIIINSILFLFFFKNSFLSIILGSILGLIFITIYNKLNLSKLKIFKYLVMVVIICLSFIVIKNITFFIEYNILKNFSQPIITLTFLGLSFFLASKGYHSYVKSLELSTYLIIFLFILSLVLVISNININNFNEQLLLELQYQNNFIYIGLSILISYISINYLNNYTINYKIYSLSIIVFILVKSLTVGIIGETLTNLYKYPYINIIKKIKYLDFIERLEGILSFPYLFIYFFLFSLMLLTIKNLCLDIYHKKKN